MAHRQAPSEFSVDTKVAVTVSSALQRTKENVSFTSGTIKELTELNLFLELKGSKSGSPPLGFQKGMGQGK
jgi:hypothetical protein